MKSSNGLKKSSLTGATTLKVFSSNTRIYPSKMELWATVTVDESCYFAAALVSKYCLIWFGLSHISDMVNGALNKIKTNRTPTNATQSDSLGRYCGRMRCCCLTYSMMIPQ